MEVFINLETEADMDKKAVIMVLEEKIVEHSMCALLCCGELG